MKIGAVINNASGVLSPEETKRRLNEIKEKLADRVSSNLLAIVPGNQVKQELERIVKQDIDILIVGGGDGTVSTAASFVAGTDISLLVLALGTKNNFAKDAGIPLNPLEAIALLDNMKKWEIDIGEVNEYTFINNATVGLYPKIVKEREKRTKRYNWQKWRAKIAAGNLVLRRLPRMRMSVEADNINTQLYSPFLFVGNNEYKEIINPNYFRESLNEGKLWLCFARSSGVSSLMLMAWHLITKGIRETDNLETHLVTDLTINTWKRKVTVAIDGENHQLKTPLRFRIRTKYLRLIVS
ncbi:MAG: diacylglycerol kinase family protein [Balneolaceae bacterium]